jgi:SMODS-associating 4TM effector domain
MAGSRRIARLQDSSRSINLLRAVSVAHGHTQSAQMASLVISFLVAGLSLLLRLVPVAALAGAVWAVTYALLVTPWRNRYLRTSATLQEMFDVEVLGLTWNRVMVGDRVPDDEVSRLSCRYRRDVTGLLGYYLVADVPAPYDVLFCLEQNLAWGSRVRRRFARVLVAVVVLWCGTGVTVALATGETVSRLISGWFVPALGLLLLCVDTFRAQLSVARARTRVLGMLRAVADDPESPVLASSDSFSTFARQVQDVLFQTRLQQPRVPTWFFQRFHDRDAADFRYKRHELEANLASAGPVTPSNPTAP